MSGKSGNSGKSNNDNRSEVEALMAREIEGHRVRLQSTFRTQGLEPDLGAVFEKVAGTIRRSGDDVGATTRKRGYWVRAARYVAATERRKQTRRERREVVVDDLALAERRVHRTSGNEVEGAYLDRIESQQRVAQIERAIDRLPEVVPTQALQTLGRNVAVFRAALVEPNNLVAERFYLSAARVTQIVETVSRWIREALTLPQA